MKPPKVIPILLFDDSRKVGFGLWLFIVAIFFFFTGKLDTESFMQAIMLSWAMIGGGTLADAWIGKKPAKNDPPAPAQ